MFFTVVSYCSITGKIIFSRRNPYESFQSSDVCELCVVVCRDFEKFKSFRMWELFTVLRVEILEFIWCVGTLKSLKVPLCVSSVFYGGQNVWNVVPVLDIFINSHENRIVICPCVGNVRPKKRWLMTTFNKPVPNFLFECIKLELLL